MKNPTTLEELEELKNNLLRQYLPENILKKFESIQVTIDLLKQEGEESEIHSISQNTEELPVQQEVVNAVLNLIESKGRRVSSAEILQFFKENHLFVNNWEDPDRKLGAILWSENKKPSGRIKKYKRGIWEKRKEKPNNASTEA